MMEDTELIIKVLEYCEFHHIRYRERNSSIRCAFDEDSNPEGVLINTDNLRSFYYKDRIDGDIFTLIQHKMGFKKFGETYKFICSVLGFSSSGDFVKRRLFGGHFSKMRSFDDREEYIYPEDYLSKYYTRVFNERFLRDGISLYAQFRYELHFDELEQRIIVPYMTENGLVGTTGRYNGEIDPDSTLPKWRIVDMFRKEDYLYGLYYNYSEIVKRNLVFVGESEKFPMQLTSMGFDYGVSTGTKKISSTQAAQLRHLAGAVILAYDEDVTEEELIEECQKIKQGLLSKVRVGYIYDRENKILPKGSKAAPSDFGKEGFLYLCKHCVTYI